MNGETALCAAAAAGSISCVEFIIRKASRNSLPPGVYVCICARLCCKRLCLCASLSLRRWLFVRDVMYRRVIAMPSACRCRKVVEKCVDSNAGVPLHCESRSDRRSHSPYVCSSKVRSGPVTHVSLCRCARVLVSAFASHSCSPRVV
jgi:hypothetical protein